MEPVQLAQRASGSELELPAISGIGTLLLGSSEALVKLVALPFQVSDLEKDIVGFGPMISVRLLAQSQSRAETDSQTDDQDHKSRKPVGTVQEATSRRTRSR